MVVLPGAERWAAVVKVLGIDPTAVRPYLAGLIDGEGWIGVSRRLPTKKNRLSAPKYSPRISVSMTDFGPVMLLAQFCDSEHTVYTRNRGDNKPIHVIDIENKKAVFLLKEIRPYLIGKKEQADLVLELADLRTKSRNFRTKVVGTGIHGSSTNARGHTYKIFGLSDEYIAKCDNIYTALLKRSPRSGNGKRFQGETK